MNKENIKPAVKAEDRMGKSIDSLK